MMANTPTMGNEAEERAKHEVMGNVHKIISYYQAVPLIGVK